MSTLDAAQSLDAFEREWDYDVTYMRELLDAGGVEALQPIEAAQAMSAYRKDVPPAAYFAAKIRAGLHEDCGPCVQLVVKMAERAGVDPAILRAVVAGDLQALPDDVRLAAEYADRTVARDPAAEPLRERIVATWGRTGLISIAYGIVAARLYPALKYALGHGHTCARVSVGGAVVVPGELAPAT